MRMCLSSYPVDDTLQILVPNRAPETTSDEYINETNPCSSLFVNIEFQAIQAALKVFEVFIRQIPDGTHLVWDQKIALFLI